MFQSTINARAKQQRPQYALIKENAKQKASSKDLKNTDDDEAEESDKLNNDSQSKSNYSKIKQQTRTDKRSTHNTKRSPLNAASEDDNNNESYNDANDDDDEDESDYQQCTPKTNQYLSPITKLKIVRPNASPSKTSKALSINKNKTMGTRSEEKQVK